MTSVRFIFLLFIIFISCHAFTFPSSSYSTTPTIGASLLGSQFNDTWLDTKYRVSSVRVNGNGNAVRGIQFCYRSIIEDGTNVCQKNLHKFTIISGTKEKMKHVILFVHVLGYVFCL